MAELTAGLRLTVFVASESEQGGKIKLASSLEGFNDNKRLLVTAPMQGMVKYPLRPKQQVSLHCQMASAIIEFEAVVLQKIDKGNLSYLLLEQITDFKRTQRRQDFRLECMKEGTLEYTDPEDSTSKKMKVAVSDISGGGVSVRSPIPFAPGTHLSAHIPVGEDASVVCYASEVRRCFEIEDSIAAMRYNVGLQFLFKDKREKEDLVSRVFKMERERKR